MLPLDDLRRAGHARSHAADRARPAPAFPRRGMLAKRRWVAARVWGGAPQAAGPRRPGAARGPRQRAASSRPRRRCRSTPPHPSTARRPGRRGAPECPASAIAAADARALCRRRPTLAAACGRQNRTAAHRRRTCRTTRPPPPRGRTAAHAPRHGPAAPSGRERPRACPSSARQRPPPRPRSSRQRCAPRTGGQKRCTRRGGLAARRPMAAGRRRSGATPPLRMTRSQKRPHVRAPGSRHQGR